MKLLVAAEAPNEENTINYSFRLRVMLLIYDQALRAFHSASANPDLARHVGQFFRAGLELAACGNTMTSPNLSLKDLLPGFVSAEKGGVVRLAELQSQGYLYLRS
jgi:intracellular sulfur oxidation DsrE/DsrF family protein